MPPSIPVWLGSGALIGLGVIVPGMSPSNFLIYFGLYDKMAEGIKDFDPSVFIPLGIGLVILGVVLAVFVTARGPVAAPGGKSGRRCVPYRTGVV